MSRTSTINPVVTWGAGALATKDIRLVIKKGDDGIRVLFSDNYMDVIYAPNKQQRDELFGAIQASMRGVNYIDTSGLPNT